MFLENMEEIRRELEATLSRKKVLSEDYILSSYVRDGTLFYYPLSKPSVVVLPDSTEDVQRIIQIANKYRIPVVASAGRTNSWGAVDSSKGIAIDMCHMNRVLEIDEKNLTFTVQAGANVHHMNRELDKMGYRYPTHPLNNAAISFG
ncbi:MAG: FAD-dependent oxidoreductase, partial [Deltaproteobacteria bacterium]|nr:FAD-dependent oxidoreductase [Deltaproteobacteria bacterium]